MFIANVNVFTRLRTSLLNSSLRDGNHRGISCGITNEIAKFVRNSRVALARCFGVRRDEIHEHIKTVFITLYNPIFLFFFSGP